MKTYEKLVTKLTRKQAINKNCKDCIYDPASAGTWRQQVEACAVTTCAFYDWRPLPFRSSILASENSHRYSLIAASLLG